jgi:hypothetical protein
MSYVLVSVRRARPEAEGFSFLASVMVEVRSPSASYAISVRRPSGSVWAVTRPALSYWYVVA